MSKKLTKRDIDSFEYKGGWDVRWDSAIPGFGVRVYPSGKKTYVLSYRHERRKRLIALGQTSKITLDTARDLAIQNMAKLTGSTDPLEERRKNSTGRTLEKVFDEFLERYAKPKNRSWREVDRIFQKDIIPTIGRKAVHEITKQDVINIIDHTVDRGSAIMANRMLAHMRKFFNWCVERDLIEISPASKISKPSQEKSRDRVLNKDEIAQIWHASDKEGYPFGSIVQLALLTAQRRTEIATMRWQDINEKDSLWTLHGDFTKNKRKHVVPLSASAMNIIQASPRHENCDYVFTANGITPFKSFGSAKTRLDKFIDQVQKNTSENIGSIDWRIHDLRRTAASGMASLGTSPHVIERILNHMTGVISGVAAVYNRYDYHDEMQTALEIWAEKLSHLNSKSENCLK